MNYQLPMQYPYLFHIPSYLLVCLYKQDRAKTIDIAIVGIAIIIESAIGKRHDKNDKRNRRKILRATTFSIAKLEEQ